MYPIDFDKQRCEEILVAIDEGRDISAPVGGWSVTEIMRLAGVLHFGALSHGPLHVHGEWRDKMPEEQREATEDTLYQDLLDAIEFYSQLSLMVKDNQYDENCEPHLQAVVVRDAAGAKTVRILKGGKKS